MGKLSIKVHGCKLHRPCPRDEVSPRVVIVVDNTYSFRTSVRKQTFEPRYDETFVVGNTHRLAVIEVSVYDVVESKNLLLHGLGLENAIGTAWRPHHSHSHRVRSISPEKKSGGFLGGLFKSGRDGDGSANATPGSADLGEGEGDTDEANLLGRCYISMERFIKGQSKMRTYALGSPIRPPGTLADDLAMPSGVAGTITVTLSSDGLGESPAALKVNDVLEHQYTERLKWFLLRVDTAKIQVLDLILANVRDTTERQKGASRYYAGNASMSLPLERSQDGLRGPLAAVGSSGTAVSVNKKFPQLTFIRPPAHETFEGLMARVCAEYDSSESTPFKVRVRIDGCTNLNKKALNTAMLGSDDVCVVVRTESEHFVTCDAKLQNTIVWTEANDVVLDVGKPETFVMHVVVVGKSSRKVYEIGRARLGVATLALEHASERHLYLCTFDNVTLPQITGVVHLSLKPLNFGLVPLELVAPIDEAYDRLSKFFQRYDVVRVPQVDTLVRARMGRLEEFIQDLIVEHGREPGSVQVLVTINEVVALQEWMGSELNDKEVRVVITMGGTAVRTKSRKTSRFVTTKFFEGYCFDVVRETDLIRLEVVKASDESVVYGRVDFTCLNIQRGVTNEKKLYLVGDAGTAGAYISGIIRFSLFSNEIGKNHAVDEEQDRFFYGRLRRYAFRRMPENLHRVSLAVDMVFDMETFMAQIASRHGEEDPTLAIYFTVIGCRQLRSRFGGVSPYVVVRVGIDSYHTKFVKDNTEPDFFEFCEFYIDRPYDHVITLIVMDRSEMGDDTEIGRAVISLQDVTIGQQYHDFLPLQPPLSRKKRRHMAKRQRAREKKRHLPFRSRSNNNLSAQSRGEQSGADRDMDEDDSSDDGSASLSRSNASTSGGLFSNGSGALGFPRGSPSMSTSEANAYDDALSRESKKRSLGFVGFKYVVADMQIVDPTRCRLLREQARRDNIYALPDSRTDEAGGGGADGARAAANASRAGGRLSRGSSVAMPGSPGDRSAGASMATREQSLRNADGAPSPRQSASKAAAAPAGNLFGGWMAAMFKGFQKTLEGMGLNPSSGSEPGKADRHRDVDAGSTTQMPLTGDDNSDRASSARSAAHVPTVNMMDEGVMDVDAFLSAPVLSAMPSATNSSVDEGEFDSEEEEEEEESESTRGSLDELEGQMGRGLAGAGGHRQEETPSPRPDGKGEGLDQFLSRVNTLSHGFESSASGDGPAEDTGEASLRRDAITNTGPKILRLRILYCKNIHATTHQKPNPYLLFATVNETHRTRIEFDTVNPRYNEEFHIHVDSPARDSLHISVLTDTPYGSKKLGHCVLSLHNVQRGEWHTRWASFVVHSHKTTAFEHGSVCLSLMGDNFGLDYLPSHDAENRLREKLREFLVSKNPAQLHRLEWFVGKYSDQDANVLSRLFGKYYISSVATQSADVTVIVKEIKQLCIDGGLLFSGSCMVRIKANGKTYGKTRSVAGTDGHFVFNETLQFKLENPGTAQIRYCIEANGKIRAGESLISLQDIHKGVAQERTHVTSINARSAHPIPSGFITCSIMSPTFGSSSIPPTDDENAYFYRLQRFLYYYKPEDVAMTDLRYSSTLNVNAYLQKLVRHFGPEPGEYKLRLLLQRCVNMHHSSARPARPAHLFAVVRCGMTEHRTSIVEGEQEYVFHETFNLVVGLPTLERVEVILFDFSPAKCVELGRTQVRLAAIVRGENNDMRLPLVRDAGTRFAEVNGLVELQVFTEDFGVTPHLRSQTTAWLNPEDATLPPGPSATTASSVACGDTPSGANFTSALWKKKSSVGLAKDNDSSSILDSVFQRRGRSQTASQDPLFPLSEGENGAGGRTAAAANRGGASAGKAAGTPSASSSRAHGGGDSAVMVRVSITGFLGFKPQDLELYLRVSSGRETLAKTKPIAVAELAALKEPVTFEVDDQFLFTDRTLTLKLGENSIWGNEAVCYADFCLARCATGTVTEKRLRLYECKTNDFLGICRLNVDVPAGASNFAGAAIEEPVPPAVAETVMDDMASLVAKYSPKDLRRLDLSFFRAADVRRLHRALRLQLCPSAVSTVYVAIHEVKLNLATGPTSLVFKHTCSVSATCGDYTAEVGKRTALSSSNASTSILPYGMSRQGISTLDFCPLRVDITPMGPDTVLTLCINDRQSKTKYTEVGRTVVSLRALLSPQVFDMGERVTVPIVDQRRAANRVHASLVGTLTFSLFPPAYETFPSSLRFAARDLDDFNREYMRYYAARIFRLLVNYDANSLVNLHVKMYEKFVPNHAWKKGLPQYLSSLVERWGPELEPSGPVPPLES